MFLSRRGGLSPLLMRIIICKGAFVVVVVVVVRLSYMVVYGKHVANAMSIQYH